VTIPVKIVGTGLYAPPRVETAAELAPRIHRSERWILTRAGVARRHVAEEPIEQMAAKAARLALGRDGPPDLLIYAATTPRQMIPDTSVFVARELGLSDVTTFSLHSTCLSFLPALQLAAAGIATGLYRRVLIVSAEIGTIARDFREPESAALLGDGAGAAVVEATPPGESSALLGISLATYPDGAELTQMRGAGMNRHPLDSATTREDYLFTMDGPAVYRMARPLLVKHVQAALEQAGLENPQQIDVVVPHQASGRALEAIAAFFKLDPERVVNIIGEYGNCVAASLPMALAQADHDGRIERGRLVLLGGTGAGLAAGVIVLRW